MRFALLNDELTEAKVGLVAICPGCTRPVVAKCGDKRVHHWAHRGTKMCDDWWEPETEWHRSWKNNFPVEWQEKFLPDRKTGEKHIADLLTPDGLVIEFQHSHIDPKERISREQFYKKMVWVVDGTRLKRDFPRFEKGRNDFRESHKPKIFKVEFVDECFPSSWLESTVPIIFDFWIAEPLAEEANVRRALYCLLPIRIGFDAFIAELPRKAFIQSISDGEWLNRVESFMKELNSLKHQYDQERKRYTNISYPRYYWPRKTRYFRRRRF